MQSAVIFKQSLINNSQFVILIWLLGITVIGVPLILLIVGIKGFIVGFSVSFLVEGMGLRAPVCRSCNSSAKPSYSTRHNSGGCAGYLLFHFYAAQKKSKPKKLYKRTGHLFNKYSFYSSYTSIGILGRRIYYPVFMKFSNTSGIFQSINLQGAKWVRE